jgi:hypothetical protein
MTSQVTRSHMTTYAPDPRPSLAQCLSFSGVHSGAAAGSPIASRLWTEFRIGGPTFFDLRGNSSPSRNPREGTPDAVIGTIPKPSSDCTFGLSIVLLEFHVLEHPGFIASAGIQWRHRHIAFIPFEFPFDVRLASAGRFRLCRADFSRHGPLEPAELCDSSGSTHTGTPVLIRMIAGRDAR